MLIYVSLATIGCGLLNNETSTVSYNWINMTIQFCVEVCRGALMPIAAITVNKLNFLSQLFRNFIILLFINSD
jgi:hypothetical protein